MSAVPLPLNEVGEEARAFRDTFQTLHLATCSSEAVPVASYAPFALTASGAFDIYVSELAAHTANLRSGRAVSVLFIEPEREAAHLFARKRLTYACDVVYCPRGTPEFEQALAAMRTRFGEFIDYMMTLTDFHAFELVPRHASYVRGFAQAYELPNADFDAIRHINDQGHRNDK